MKGNQSTEGGEGITVDYQEIVSSLLPHTRIVMSFFQELLWIAYTLRIIQGFYPPIGQKMAT